MSNFYGDGSDLRQMEDITTWNPRTGYTIIRPWRGSKDRIQQKFLDEQLLNNPSELIPPAEGGNGDWELRVTYAATETDQVLSDQWELDGNTLEKELWEMPFVRDEFLSIKDTATGNPTGNPLLVSVACINWIRKNIEAFIAGSATTMTTLDDQSLPLTYANLYSYCLSYGFHADAFERLIHLYARGVKVFPVSQFVLRRMRTVGNNFGRENIANIYDDVFKRRTTESLISAEAIPDNIRFSLPSGQWVKQTPTITQSTVSKWTVKEEWWHGDIIEEEIYGPLI